MRQLTNRLLQQLKLHDRWSYEHSIRVGRMFTAVMPAIGQATLDMLCGAYLHDIGKLMVPLRILQKPHALTDSEFEIMKSHAGIGASILKKYGFSRLTCDMARYHHERLDGKGYTGLPTPSEVVQVLSVCDAFDAIHADRVYRKGRPAEETWHILQCAEGQFDPSLVRRIHHLWNLLQCDEKVGRLAI